MKKKIFIALSVFTLLLTIVIFSKRKSIPESPIKILQTEDLKVGTGDLAMVGKRIKIHYTASVYQGQIFESTREKNSPLSFRLGNGETIAGFEQGIPGMKVGGIRILTMPPDMGFGKSGSSQRIPPNSALVYEVELLEAKGN
jgi:FKBP-type peptidyl-prolyl cis-trans isomerase